ncbi:MAG: ATP-binding cassette domain-containing protein [Planctomycetota bacterium]
MPLVQLDDLTIGYRGPPLLDGVTRQIEAGQRIGLLGRNGSGKTTLLRMIAGEEQPDKGRCTVTPGTRLAYLTQEVPLDAAGPAETVVRQTLDAAVAAHQLEGWEADDRVARTLARMQIDPADDLAEMSAGLKRRTLLAQALVTQPHLLLLDEPTNHLDLSAIDWLEEFLADWSGTLIFVTHDRAFLRKLATRIWEIDRGRLFDWSCDYDTFLARKADALHAEEKQNSLFDKRLAEEEVWIRQGVKARRTRNEGRVRALKAMRSERSQRRNQVGKAKLVIQEAARSGNLVCAVEELSFHFDGKPILEDFSTEILRGDKVGIIGPNGAGKTTLLKLLLGQLKPQQGTVRLGTNLAIAYFDQLRGQLDGEKSIADNVANGNDSVTIGGNKRHIIGYLEDFLFSPERSRTQVRFLSGGERHRVLLAKLFTQPANVIVLDEPTNDLDAETLELLEQRLVEFAGTILMVSHDREFLNNVATSVIAYEETGVREYVGGYDDWVRQRSATQSPASEARRPEASRAAAVTTMKKRSFKEQREMDLLPATIEKLEAEIATLHGQVAAPAFYKQPQAEIAATQRQLKGCEDQLAAAFRRWAALE